ncbi:MAG TPA: sulfur carrier protein ThiS [Holophagaceae bacterium]|nr:sulfur carrier protein ThiS [Holophagaceae bacterium]
MKLLLNGAEREAPALATVAELSAWLGLPAFGTAIELNGAVIRRAEHQATPLREGDRLEIVKLVGGG